MYNKESNIQDQWKAVDTYIEERFTPQDEALQHTFQTSVAEGMPGGTVSPNQGHFLSLLVLLSKTRRILEVGTLGGYSSLWLARELPEDGYMLTLDKDPKHVSVARANIAHAGLSHKIEVRLGDACDTMAQLAQEQVEPFDMIFIDPDIKTIYTELLEHSIRLTRPGSVIIADNAIRRGMILDPDNHEESVTGIRDFNTALAAHPKLSATLLQTVGAKGWDGIAMAVVRE